MVKELDICHLLAIDRDGNPLAPCLDKKSGDTRTFVSNRITHIQGRAPDNIRLQVNNLQSQLFTRKEGFREDLYHKLLKESTGERKWECCPETPSDKATNRRQRTLNKLAESWKTTPDTIATAFGDISEAAWRDAVHLREYPWPSVQEALQEAVRIRRHGDGKKGSSREPEIPQPIDFRNALKTLQKSYPEVSLVSFQNSIALSTSSREGSSGHAGKDIASGASVLRPESHLPTPATMSSPEARRSGRHPKRRRLDGPNQPATPPQDLRPPPPPAKQQDFDCVEEDDDTKHLQAVQEPGKDVLSCLAPLVCLNDVVIHRILSLVVSLNPTSAMLIDSLIIGKASLPSRILAKFENLRPTTAIAALNIPQGKHWVLVVLTAEEALIYDSTSSPGDMKDDQVFRAVKHLSAQLQPPEKRNIKKVRCTQQTNSSDCGIATILHALMYVVQHKPTRPASETSAITEIWLSLWRKIFLAMLSPDETVHLEYDADPEMPIKPPPLKMTASAFLLWSKEEQARLESALEALRAQHLTVQSLCREALHLLDALLALGEIQSPEPTNVISRALSGHKAARQSLLDSGHYSKQTINDISAGITQLEAMDKTRERAREVLHRVRSQVRELVKVAGES